MEAKSDECVLPGALDFSGRISHIEVNIYSKLIPTTKLIREKKIMKLISNFQLSLGLIQNKIDYLYISPPNIDEPHTMISKVP